MGENTILHFLKFFFREEQEAQWSEMLPPTQNSSILLKVCLVNLKGLLHPRHDTRENVVPCRKTKKEETMRVSSLFHRDGVFQVGKRLLVTLGLIQRAEHHTGEALP